MLLIDDGPGMDDWLAAQQYVPDLATDGQASVDAGTGPVPEPIFWQYASAGRIEDHDVGVRTGSQRALCGVMAERPRRVLRRELHDALDGQAPGRGR